MSYSVTSLMSSMINSHKMYGNQILILCKKSIRNNLTITARGKNIYLHFILLKFNLRKGGHGSSGSNQCIHPHDVPDFNLFGATVSINIIGFPVLIYK